MSGEIDQLFFCLISLSLPLRERWQNLINSLMVFLFWRGNEVAWCRLAAETENVQCTPFAKWIAKEIFCNLRGDILLRQERTNKRARKKGRPNRTGVKQNLRIKSSARIKNASSETSYSRFLPLVGINRPFRRRCINKDSRL